MPLGTDVLLFEERSNIEAVEVDSKPVNAREQGGEFLDTAERTTVEAVEVDASAISMRESGDDLSGKQRSLYLPPLRLIPVLSLADVGVDMLAEDKGCMCRSLSVIFHHL